MRRWIFIALLGLGSASAQLLPPGSSPDFTSVEPARVTQIGSVTANTGPEFSVFEFRLRNDGGRTFRNGALSLRLIMDGAATEPYPVSECTNTAAGPFNRLKNVVELSAPVEIELRVEDGMGGFRDYGTTTATPDTLCDEFARLILSPDDATIRPSIGPGDVIWVKVKVYVTYNGQGYTDPKAALRLQLQAITDQGVAASDVSVQEIRPVWPRLKVGLLGHECFVFDPACSAAYVMQVTPAGSPGYLSMDFGSGQPFLVGGIMLPPPGERRLNARMTFAVPDVGSGCDSYGLGGLKDAVIARRGTGAWTTLAALMPLQPGDRVTFGADTNGNGQLDSGDVLEDGEFVSVGVRCFGPLFGGQAQSNRPVSRNDVHAPTSAMVFW